MPRPVSSSSEEDNEEITTAEIVTLWDKQLHQMLTRLENISRTKIEDSLRKSDATRIDFKRRMELLQKETDKIKIERKKHEEDLKKLRGEFEKAKSDHVVELDELKNQHQQQLKENENFHSKRYKLLLEQHEVLKKRIARPGPRELAAQTLSANNVRRLIGTLARPLAEITKNQLINMRIIDEKNAEIRECIAKNKDLRGRLVIETVNIEAEELDYPITVCTHKDCVEYRTLNNGGVQETIYKTECHVPCYLEGVETSVCPNPKLLKCEVFLNPDSCSECGHSWQTHMHVRYRLIQDITRTEDPMVGRKVRGRDSQIAIAREFIAAQEAKRDERQKETDKIQHYCAHFAAYLKKYSDIPNNDAYLEYLDHLIKEEEAKVNAGGFNKMLSELKSYRSAYDQQRLTFTSKTGAPLKTLDEINNMVKELEILTFSREIIQETQNLELLTAKKAHQPTAISVNKSFISNAFRIVARPARQVNNTVKGMMY